jgi:hypothetical protein
MSGFFRARKVDAGTVEQLLYGEPLPDKARREKLIAQGIGAGAAEAREHMEKARLLLALQQAGEKPPTKSKGEKPMTVSLYSSNATGKREIVVQTNAQSLDLFISGLADALDVAVGSMEPSERAEMLASVLRNAFPVAYAISGYKAERVSETRMLSCGAASPDAGNLLAHSRT